MKILSKQNKIKKLPKHPFLDYGINKNNQIMLSHWKEHQIKYKKTWKLNKINRQIPIKTKKVFNLKVLLHNINKMKLNKIVYKKYRKLKEYWNKNSLKIQIFWAKFHYLKVNKLMKNSKNKKQNNRFHGQN